MIVKLNYQLGQEVSKEVDFPVRRLIFFAILFFLGLIQSLYLVKNTAKQFLLDSHRIDVMDQMGADPKELADLSQPKQEPKNKTLQIYRNELVTVEAQDIIWGKSGIKLKLNFASLVKEGNAKPEITYKVLLKIRGQSQSKVGYLASNDPRYLISERSQALRNSVSHSFSINGSQDFYEEFFLTDVIGKDLDLLGLLFLKINNEMTVVHEFLISKNL